jgi:hypothetical protein
MGNIRGWMVLCLAAVSLSAQAQEWETIATGPIVIKVRSWPGSAVREVWAEGDMEVEVQDIQAAVMDAEAYPRFMPYIKESRFIGQADANGSGIVYTRMEPPIVQKRDCVLKVTLKKGVDEDGQGTFANRWEALPDHLPTRTNVVRLRTNEGSWEARPTSSGHSHVTYRFAVDPGGWLPSFAVNIGHKTGVMDAFRAIEREARRRAAERQHHQVSTVGPAADARRTPNR